LAKTPRGHGFNLPVFDAIKNPKARAKKPHKVGRVVGQLSRITRVLNRLKQNPKSTGKKKKPLTPRPFNGRP
jgi:hypothetical protein